jgi:S-adenosylmethionine uptake transporter
MVLSMKSAWMLVAASSFATMAACVKFLSGEYRSTEILFYRCLISAAIVAAWALMRGHRLSTPHWREHARRASFGAGAMGAWYYTLGVLPIATSVTLNYTSPIFVGLLTAYAGWRGHEKTVRKLSYIALVFGFLGVLIMLTPSANVDQTQHILIGLLGAFVAALSFKDVRRLASLGETEIRMVFYFCLFASVFAAVPMSLQPMQSLSLRGVSVLCVIGMLGVIGQLAVSYAFGHGDVLLSASLQYTGVVFATLIGFFVWDELLSIGKQLGIAAIVIAGVLSAVAAKR